VTILTILFVSLFYLMPKNNKDQDYVDPPERKERKKPIEVISGKAGPLTLADKQNQVVLVTGIPKVRGIVWDAELNIQWPKKSLVSLNRQVSVYQWSESRATQTDKSSEVSHDYNASWSTNHIDSRSFRNAEYRNQNIEPSLSSRNFNCDRVFIGEIEIDVGYLRFLLPTKELEV
jgi:hypothetical protein